LKSVVFPELGLPTRAIVRIGAVPPESRIGVRPSFGRREQVLHRRRRCFYDRETCIRRASVLSNPTRVCDTSQMMLPYPLDMQRMIAFSQKPNSLRRTDISGRPPKRRIRTLAPIGTSLRVMGSFCVIGQLPSFLALDTCAEYLERRTLGRKGFIVAYLILYRLEPFIDKFDDIAAFQADQVVMLRAAERFLVPGGALREPVFGDQPAILQEIKRVVDCCLGDFDPFGDHSVVQILGVKVPLALQYGIEDRKTRRGGPQLPLRPQILRQDFVCAFSIHREAFFRIGLNKNRENNPASQVILRVFFWPGSFHGPFN
jgi:hypothetical protein